MRMLPILLGALSLQGCGNFRLGGSSALADEDKGFVVGPVLEDASSTGIEVMWDRQFGFLRETLVAPVPRANIMIGRTSIDPMRCVTCSSSPSMYG